MVLNFTEFVKIQAFQKRWWVADGWSTFVLEMFGGRTSVLDGLGLTSVSLNDFGDVHLKNTRQIRSRMFVRHSKIFVWRPQISQRFQPQFVVLNFTEFVKRQVCQKRGWVADGWSMCDIFFCNSWPETSQDAYRTSTNRSGIGWRVRYMHLVIFRAKSLCSPNEDLGRLNKALRMRFWTSFQSVVAQNEY